MTKKTKQVGNYLITLEGEEVVIYSEVRDVQNRKHWRQTLRLEHLPYVGDGREARLVAQMVAFFRETYFDD